MAVDLDANARPVIMTRGRMPMNMRHTGPYFLAHCSYEPCIILVFISAALPSSQCGGGPGM